MLEQTGRKPMRTSLRTPTSVSGNVPKILVIGAGVSGLTTALCARQRGYQVVVAADRFAPDLTSVVAGALWEWPPAVCGHHRDGRSLERSRVWCQRSYEAFCALACDPRTGVFVRRACFYFRRPVEEDPFELGKMRELRPHVRGFRHDAALIERNGVDPGAGARDAYAHLAPMVDTDAYMDWLLERVLAAGCQVRRRRIEGPLAEREAALCREFGVDAIVNCTGLGALELTGEDMYPLRGALVYVRNDGVDMPRVTAAHCMAFDEAVGGQNMVFIVPRGERLLVLGGLVEPGEWDTGLTLESYPPLREMRRRCEDFLPVLRRARLYDERPVRAGLRPARPGNVRLEREPGTRIVHNVGHGGSGVTFSWGCAAEVADLLDAMLEGCADKVA
jgi:D-amino-acid oxidase